jgi:hypothetical protein
MSIVLQGSTSGSVTLQEPAIAGTTVLDLPATSGTILTSASAISASSITTGTLPKAQLPTGSVLQVVSTTKTDVFSTSTTGSYVDVTGLSVSITPTSSSSKILVMVTMNGVASDNSGARLLRGSTVIAVGDAGGSRIQGTMSDFYLNNSGNSQKSFAKTFLDSPATTSSTTYKIQVQTPSGTFYVNSGNGDGDNIYNTRTISTITLMEIAA